MRSRRTPAAFSPRPIPDWSTTPAAGRGFEHLEEVYEGGSLNEDFGAATYPDGVRMVATGEAAYYPPVVDYGAELQVQAAAYSIGTSPQKAVVIEPRAAGRWYEVGEDGSECAWGEVLAWDPPGRLVLAWRVGADWRFDPNLLTEVEVRFVAVGAASTRVELEHRLLDNVGASAEAARASFDSQQGWSGVLASYAAAVSD